jgi:hypothetical protein
VIDELIVEDFMITTADLEIKGCDQFKQWVAGFLKTVSESNLENLDILKVKMASKWYQDGNLPVLIAVCLNNIFRILIYSGRKRSCVLPNLFYVQIFHQDVVPFCQIR